VTTPPAPPGQYSGVVQDRKIHVDYDTDDVFPAAIEHRDSNDRTVTRETLMHHPGLGVLAGRVSPNGAFTAFQYDGFGQLLSVKRPQTGTVQNPPLADVFLEYTTSFGYPLSVITTDRAAGISIDSFDRLGRLVLNKTKASRDRWVSTKVLYKETGEVSDVFTPTFGTPTAKTQYQFDAAGRVLKTTEPGTPETTYSYNGLVTTTTTPPPRLGEATVTTQELRDLGGRVVTQQRGTMVTGYSYGPFGELETVTLPGGAGTVTYELDKLGRRRKFTDRNSGEIVFVPNPSAGLFRIPVAGGKATPVPTPATSDGALLQGYPRALPDGRHVLFFTLNADGSRSGVYALDIDSGQTTNVTPAMSRVEFTGGRLFYSRDGSLFAHPFEAASLTLSGEPVRIVDDVGRSGGASRFNYAFSVADDGTLAYWSGTATPVMQLAWFDRSGRRVRTVGAPEVYHGFEVSPDGKQITVERADPRTTLTDIRLIALDQGPGAATPLISAPEGQVANVPVWSPDGRSLMYALTATELYIRDLTTGENRKIATDAGGKWPTSWSPDGQYIVMDRTTNVGELWVQSLAADGKAIPYLKTSYNAQGGQISPDGRWLAYRADETGDFEIYIDSFPRPGRKIRVSLNGGSRARWRRDGRELYFIARDRRLMAVSITPSGDRLQIGEPQPLFEAPVVGIQFNRTQYVPSADGQQFLFNAQVDDPSRQGISIGRGVIPVSGR